MPKRIDITGNVYGRLTVTKYHSTNPKGKPMWECICKCGNTTVVIGENLKAGATTSCGCYRKEVEVVASKTHGLSKTRLYREWQDIKKRCYYVKNKEYKNYGARGIRVCDEWLHDYMAFHEWAMHNGYNDELTIDRINVNGNYEPSNCKWATWTEQGRNKRLSPRNTSGVSGVTYKKQRGLYVARIGVNGKRVFLGEFKTFDEAVKARKEAEAKYWG